MRVIVSGDATLFPKMLVFLESLGFERVERDENRYFIITLENTENQTTSVAYHSVAYRLTVRYYSGSDPT
jgi:hypothetical protein